MSNTHALPSDPNTVDGLFVREAAKMPSPRVLQMGTRRWRPEHSTRIDHWIPHAGTHHGTDIQEGIDVDIVCDAHRLSDSIRPGEYDIVISRSVFEHLRKPWIVADEIHFILKRGGLVYVQTHQSYPVHGYPEDYWRFTTEAMRVLFDKDDGWDVLATDYLYAADVVPREPMSGWNPAAPAWLNVNLLARRV